MKKAVYLMAAVLLTACGSGSKSVEMANDSTAVDSVEATKTAPEAEPIDTATIVGEAGEALDGFLKAAQKDYNDSGWEAYKLVTNKYFTSSLTKEYGSLLSEVKEKCKKMPAQGGVGYVPQTTPHSPFFCCGTIDGTDCGISIDKYRIESIESNDGYNTLEIKVKVNYQQMCAGEENPEYGKSTVTYVMVKENDGWRIDNIFNKEFKGGSLRESITNKSAITPEPYI